jgi:hypothetical protein
MGSFGFLLMLRPAENRAEANGFKIMMIASWLLLIDS